MQSGHLHQALAILRELLAVEPGYAEAWYKQGNVLKDLARPLDALDCYRRAIDLKAGFTAALSNSGVVLLRLGRAPEALNALLRAVDADPGDAVVRYNCASAYAAMGRADLAIMNYRKAVLLRPDYAEAHFHCANALAGLDRWEDALASYDAALALDPGNVAAHLHRGNVLRQLQRWEAALASYQRAIDIAPDLVDGHFNRGVLLEQLGRLAEAVSSFDSAIAIRPDFAPAHYNRALALLSGGNLPEGLRGYEWRWKNREPSTSAAEYRGRIPLWTGHESLEGKTILVFSEQGLGDTLQFCRYIRMVAQRGARVVFEVQEPLAGLLQATPGAARVVPRGGAIPHCDYKCPLLSLPLAFNTTLDTIPDGRKYLQVDEALVRSWETRLGPHTRPRIGLAWSGNAAYPNDHFRSLSLARLAGPLPREFDYFCLQKDLREDDRAFLDAHPHIVNHASDFSDAAAMCEGMDLVVSVCTSIAHLAGALGRPLWVLLAFNADWRWLKGRQDSPWYPTAKLYRQSSSGDWDGVIARVSADLRDHLLTKLR